MRTLSSRQTWTTLATAALLLTSAAGVRAQEPEQVQTQGQSAAEMAWTSTYELPGADVQELFARDKNYATLDTASPEGRWFLVPHFDELSTVAEVGRPTQRLAGLELRGQRNRTWRLDNYGIDGAELFDLSTGERHPIELPGDSHYSDFTWAADDAHMAVLRHGPEQTELWMIDLASGRAGRLGNASVMATLAARVEGRSARQSSMVQITPSGAVITLAVPASRGAAPTSSLPSGPIVRRTRAAAARNPTYPFLLEDAAEADLFRYHTTSQIVRVERDGTVVPLGEPGMFTAIQLSPDGEHLRTERLVEPLSPLVNWSSFGTTTEVRDSSGAVITTLVERPLSEGRGGDRGADAPREIAWIPDGSGLVWLQREARPEQAAADADADAMDIAAVEETEEASGARLDTVMVLASPFTGDAVAVLTSEESLSSLALAGADRVFAEHDEPDGDGRVLSTWDLTPADPTPVVVVGPWDPADPLAQVGDLVTRSDNNGVQSVRLSSDGTAAFLAGDGYQEDFRPRPFIDRVALDGSGASRVFAGASDMFETPLVPLDADMEHLVVERESATEFPNSWEWTAADGFTRNLTANTDPFPEITAAVRRDFEVTRRDGLTFQARISMPVGWEEGQRVPAIFWTYPREYRSERDYERAAVRGRNRNAFTHLSYLRWSDIWLSQGYAVVYPDVPITGDPYNDHFIQDLTDSLYASIRAVDRMGLVDIDRIGHGGHSYGAFATGNLLAHTPFFQAGIAGDGAYNRTLTPLGFQSERRALWDAQDVYLEMSPFFQADHIDTPLLMYHGGDDNNTGTFPIQSRRMMQALQGLGKNAVLYEYPFESHSASAVESYLDLWKRFLDFFDEYVKNPAAASEAGE